MGWLLHILGIDDTASNWYGFWSGFGSDLGELALIGSLIALVKTRTCEVHRCWRPGVHTTAAGHRVCRRHHPDDHLTAGAVREAHETATSER